MKQQTKTLEIAGLTPPEKKVFQPQGLGLFANNPANANQLETQIVKSEDGKVKLVIDLKLAEGYKVNELAPASYRLTEEGQLLDTQKIQLGKSNKLPPNSHLEIELPVKGEGTSKLNLSLAFYYCQSSGEGLCKMKEAAWTIPVTITKDGKSNEIKLTQSAN